jgi:hypothetical protein
VEPARRDRDALRAELLRDCHRARKLVRLHPDQADKPAIGRVDAPRDFLYRDDGVALVIGVDLDLDVRAKHFLRRRVLRDGVKAGQRIRWHPGFRPLNHIAVVVVMRRLDQLDDKTARGHLAKREGFLGRLKV